MKKLIELLLNFLRKIFGKKENDNGGLTVGESENIEVNTENVEETAQEAEETDEPDDEDDAVLETVAPDEKPKIKILVDNGHGNNTAGKRSPYSMHKVEPAIDFYEYKWNREIAKPIVDELVRRGYDAELLVPEITDISLTERANRANAWCKKLGKNRVLLLSIHANAAGSGRQWMTGRGWCAYTTRGETKSDKFAEFLYKEAEKNFKGHRLRRDTTDGDSDQEANFTIIYNSWCPAVLTENFFYDNVDDVRYILSEEGRAAVIKTHVDGIINYINSL